ncbi:LAS21 [Candida oxycetoniae]|uniref:GPI ethanolamine phosphate transferase 2 n=1 Tax=Candida oxycetoniae TaxID=497107 RepID=A0AAI9T030_9ASCO|nr:LAS21 [Candida oxycetoniae]KAI3406388.2 LAS21 [Candida oxycetoniae]
MIKSLKLGWALYLVISLANILGFVIFLKGFFPTKKVLPGFGTFYETEEANSTSALDPAASVSAASPFLDENGLPKYNKFILMVVDAMRSDFCFGKDSEFTFLQSLIYQGNAIPFTAYSNPPTVTLPRLKGITTGGTPSFLDAILNVADDYDNSQSLFTSDSWVHQFKQQNKSINFFGDDTWLKLFPGQFAEFEGTNSFFVSDFTEVDNNVTRHLDLQLKPNNNWHGLILHYLGLDHIGHKGGPDSVYMKPKQKEMDAIVKRLYQFIEEKENNDTLLILMGDHGMNEIGNHGGSSLGETSAALTVISPKLEMKMNKYSSTSPHPPPQTIQSSKYSYYNDILQIDLVPTMACLLNFPIPKNSLGVIPKQVVELWTEEKRRSILLQNCYQIMELYIAKNGKKGALWSTFLDLKSKVLPLDAYYAFLHDVQHELASSATEYNYNEMYLGVFLVSLSAIITIIIFNAYFLRFSHANFAKVVLFQVFTFLYAIHFHGSSFIEEEHQIWNFATSLILIYCGLAFFNVFEKRNKVFTLLFLFTSLRVLKSWNTAGQKWFSNNNISNYLQDNVELLWALNFATYFACTVLTYIQDRYGIGYALPESIHLLDTKDLGSFLSFTMIFVATSLSFIFKMVQFYVDGRSLPKILSWPLNWALVNFGVELNEYSAAATDPTSKFLLQKASVSLSKLSVNTLFGGLIIRLIIGRLRGRRVGRITDITNAVTIYLLHQTDCSNIPIFLVLMIAKFLLSKLVVQKTSNIDDYVLVITSLTLFLQNSTFFSMGNTNSLATVDLSNAYNGIESYNIFLVGLQTFTSNFAGPIFWSLSALQLIFEPSIVSCSKRKSKSVELIDYPKLTTTIILVKSLISLLFYSISAVGLIVSCINLRFHLFIWTVFSPKLLFFGSWLVFVNFLVDIVSAMVIVSV